MFKRNRKPTLDKLRYSDSVIYVGDYKFVLVNSGEAIKTYLMDKVLHKKETDYFLETLKEYQPKDNNIFVYFREWNTVIRLDVMFNDGAKNYQEKKYRKMENELINMDKRMKSIECYVR